MTNKKTLANIKQYIRNKSKYMTQTINTKSLTIQSQYTGTERRGRNIDVRKIDVFCVDTKERIYTTTTTLTLNTITVLPSL